MRAPILLALALLLAALAAPASAARLERTTLIDVGESGPAEADLDRDGVLERLLSPRRADGFTHDPFLEPACGTRRRLGPGDERVVVETLRVRGRRARPLIGVFGSSGASGRIQRTRIHRLLPPRSPGACPRLRTLFRFPHRRTRTPRPPRGTSPGSFGTLPRARRGRVWLRTFEGLYRADDAGCCPSYTRRIDWRPKGGRYVRHRVRVRRVQQP